METTELRGVPALKNESRPAVDWDDVRAQFPILHQTVRKDRPLTYLDSAATAQKPRAVIDAVRSYYERDNANVHRGVHALSERATEAFEGARRQVQHFLGAASYREIVFVRGATEGVNLVAHAFGERFREGEEVLITEMEHHSNIVPWQMLCERKGLKLRVVPIHDDGTLDLDAFDRLLCDKTRIVALTHASNALGTINPVAEIVARAHAAGVPVMLDGAQATPHIPVNVKELDVDFYVFSGHKAYGPTGIGALYAKREHLESMPPFLGGGDMILSVTFERTLYNEIPFKFEAGTPNIAGAVGLGKACEFLARIGMDRVFEHETELLRYGTATLEAIDGLHLVGRAKDKVGVLSFLLDQAHPHDVGTILDQEGVAIRAGHHCAQPVMEHFAVAATCRASLGVYNTRADIDRLVAGLQRVVEVFG